MSTQAFYSIGYALRVRLAKLAVSVDDLTAIERLYDAKGSADDMALARRVAAAHGIDFEEVEADPSLGCDGHPAVCDCSYHENARRAEETHREPSTVPLPGEADPPELQHAVRLYGPPALKPAFAAEAARRRVGFNRPPATPSVDAAPGSLAFQANETATAQLMRYGAHEGRSYAETLSATHIKLLWDALELALGGRSPVAGYQRPVSGEVALEAIRGMLQRVERTGQ